MPVPQHGLDLWLNAGAGVTGTIFPPLLVYRLSQQLLLGFVRCELNALAAFPRLGRSHFGARPAGTFNFLKFEQRK